MAIHSILRRLCVCFDSLKPEIKEILKDTDDKNLKENKEKCEHLLKRLKNIKSNEECSICFDETPITNLYELKCSCRNKFYHKDCLKKWLCKSGSCPFCRKKMYL